MASKSPRFYAGPPLGKDTVRALDGQTWKAGQPGYFDSGYARPLATDGVVVKFVFSADQDTAASSSTVNIERIESASQQFVGYVTTDGVDTVAVIAEVGLSYGISVDTYVATVNTNETSAAAVKIDKLLSDVEPYKNKITDSPGQVVFHYKQAILDA